MAGREATHSRLCYVLIPELSVLWRDQTPLPLCNLSQTPFTMLTSPLFGVS